MTSFSVRRARKEKVIPRAVRHSDKMVLSCFFQGGIQKISFPKNDLWGGLELKKLYRKCRLTKSSNIFFHFTEFLL